MKKFITVFSIGLFFSGALIADENQVINNQSQLHLESSAAACGTACGYDLCCSKSGAMVVGSIAAAIVASGQTDTEDPDTAP